MLTRARKAKVIAYRGLVHGVMSRHIYKVAVYVRVGKDVEGFWVSEYVDVYCAHTDTETIRGNEEQVSDTLTKKPFTQFKCNNLEDGLPVRTA